MRAWAFYGWALADGRADGASEPSSISASGNGFGEGTAGPWGGGTGEGSTGFGGDGDSRSSMNESCCRRRDE